MALTYLLFTSLTAMFIIQSSSNLAFLDDVVKERRLQTKNTCPVNKCGEENSKKCYESTGDVLQGNKVNIFNGCKDSDKYCDISTNTCLDKVKGDYEKDSRYPGEKSDELDQCAAYAIIVPHGAGSTKGLGDGVCMGKAEGEDCLSHNACEVGTYCKGNKCTSLTAIDSECTQNIECVAGTVCELNLGADVKTCVAISTFPDFTDVTRNNSKAALCESMYVHKVDDKYICARRDYEDSTLAEDGYIKCQREEKCKYTIQVGEDKSVPDTLDCVCSEYSEEGQGYCPFAEENADLKDKFTSLRDKLKELMGKDLHVLHRDMIDEEGYSPECIDFYTNPKYKEYQHCIADKILKLRKECTKFSHSTLLNMQGILLMFLMIIFV
mmetsp:Transcript_15718/g.16306  ORF Transcript_15718/g.16306 Transcript_15718/m.16306 type:complete len:381 (+) Transcript_15718:27-1169(+)